MHSIWIADDDEAIRLVLEESLSSSGFKTESFPSGEELIKRLEQDKPDLIITDEVKSRLNEAIQSETVENFSIRGKKNQITVHKVAV